MSPTDRSAASRTAGVDIVPDDVLDPTFRVARGCLDDHPATSHLDWDVRNSLAQGILDALEPLLPGQAAIERANERLEGEVALLEAKLAELEDELGERDSELKVARERNVRLGRAVANLERRLTELAAATGGAE